MDTGNIQTPTGMQPLPSIERQKSFIIENEFALHTAARKAIVDLVMLSIADAEEEPDVSLPIGTVMIRGRPRQITLNSNAKNEINIDLNALEDFNPGILTHIYNIIASRRRELDTAVE